MPANLTNAITQTQISIRIHISFRAMISPLFYPFPALNTVIWIAIYRRHYPKSPYLGVDTTNHINYNVGRYGAKWSIQTTICLILVCEWGNRTNFLIWDNSLARFPKQRNPIMQVPGGRQTCFWANTPTVWITRDGSRSRPSFATS